MILDGRLHPGDRLPPEADLALDLGLSRSSLREAVRALCFLRVLEARQGDGTYVSSLGPAMLLDALSLVVDLQRDDTLLDVVAVRRMLEPQATALAAQHRTPVLVRDLRASYERSERCTTVQQHVDEDLHFHRTLADASGNPVLASLLDGLSAPTVRLRVWRGLSDSDNLHRTLVEHRTILEAVQAGDPDRARAAAVLHVAGVESWLASAAGQGGAPRCRPT
ncbi:FadR/GntR family transcriptional regulator [Kineococcus siccus]|uniref:FadR/GntR family transcriptional regulator n=1 Tax=Kineococcus siccus TaxID=2696567 RepID=UPI003B82E54B